MLRLLRLRPLLATLIAGCLWVLSCLNAPAALALTQIKLFDVSYQSCPADLAEGVVTPGGASMDATCYMVVGKAENSTNRLVYNADIFGRVYDANHNPVMQNRTRLGSIEEVPPGVTDFSLRITVPANQPEPLQLEQFKASGFSGPVRR